MVSVFTWVGSTGFEPVTPAMSRQCSSAELTAQEHDQYISLCPSLSRVMLTEIQLFVEVQKIWGITLVIVTYQQRWYAVDCA
jgi:hypothetical protein